jgi:DNA-directed RNA polymerase specialized sigma24 family protein
VPDREQAVDELSAEVYDELRALATHYLSAERPDHTLQPTALVHEAYVRLARSGRVEVQGRSHFVAIAARVMRQVLVDHARAHRAAKRGGAIPKVALFDAVARLEEPAIDPRMCKLVELKYFGGLTNAEAAEVLGTSQRTVEREWSMARAWLHRRMTKG